MLFTIQEFISRFDTKIFFTIKYDFWYHLLRELHRKETKIFVVSALFYEKQIFFKPYGKWFANELKKNVDWFFHQTLRSEQLAKNIGFVQSSISGDTRFDRMIFRLPIVRKNSVSYFFRLCAARVRMGWMRNVPYAPIPASLLSTTNSLVAA